MLITNLKGSCWSRWWQESLFGRKDDDIEPFGGFEGLFEQINNHMGRLMSAMPQQVKALKFHHTRVNLGADI